MGSNKSKLKPETYDNINGYTLEKLLGKGQFGKVYSGKSPDGTPVAIKVMYGKKDYIDEVDALYFLADCPHVINMIDHFQNGDEFYIITELMDGNIESLKLNTPDEFMAMVEQLIAGLKAIHSAHSAHQDIKGANVLFRKNIYKYADLGLVCDKVVCQPIGTLIYKSPEFFSIKTKTVPLQALQKQDIWALGIVLFNRAIQYLHDHPKLKSMQSIPDIYVQPSDVPSASAGGQSESDLSSLISSNNMDYYVYSTGDNGSLALPFGMFDYREMRGKNLKQSDVSVLNFQAAGFPDNWLVWFNKAVNNMLQVDPNGRIL